MSSSNLDHHLQQLNIESTQDSQQETDNMPPTFHDYEILVTPSQRQVITHPVDTGATLQVIAGPGSGKTTTLVSKIAYMVGNLSIEPSEILVLSMTNKAVDTLKSQLSNIFGERVNIDVTTFHGFAHRCVIANDKAQENGIQIIEESGWRTLVQLVGGKLKKNHLVSIVDQIRRDGWKERDIQMFCRKHKVGVDEIKDVMQTLNTANVLIHSDVMRGAKFFIKEGRVSLPYKVIIVDEFQDVYPDIYELVELIAKDAHLIIAGDPYQSIYSFLGSNIKVNEAISKFKPVQKLYLSESFRSTPEIIKASDSLMLRENPSVALKEPSGFKPVAKLFGDITNQYEYVAVEIKRLIQESGGVIEPNDITILAKTNNELAKFKKVLNFYGLLDIKLSSNPPWLSDGLFHLIDYLRVLYTPDTSNFSVLCTMNLIPGIGPMTIKKYQKSALEDELSIWDHLKRLRENGNLIPKLVPYVDKIEEIKQSMNFDDPDSIFKHLLVLADELGLKKEMSKTIETRADKDQITSQLFDFFENLKLSNSFKDDGICLAQHFLKNYLEVLPISKTKQSVKLSTIHSAKGLEFPIVFILASEYGDDFRTESKRMTYVAMTRAKSLLYMNMIKTTPLSTVNFKKKFTEEFFTTEKPKIKGAFTTAFAKEFKRPIISTAVPNKNFIRSFYTLTRIVKRI